MISVSQRYQQPLELWAGPGRISFMFQVSLKTRENLVQAVYLKGPEAYKAPKETQHEIYNVSTQWEHLSACFLPVVPWMW